MINVLIVEDSPTVQAALTKIINESTDMKVVGIAHNGFQAVSMAARLNPDVITLDIHMPGMDGLEAARKILENNTIPILVVTKTIHRNIDTVFQILEIGALDVIKTPGVTEMNVSTGVYKLDGSELLNKIRVVSQLKSVIRQKKIMKKSIIKDDDNIAPRILKPKKNSSADFSFNEKTGFIVAIGASTGGPRIIKNILAELPSNFPAGIVIAQHMEAGFTTGFADWLDAECRIDVKEAKNNDLILPGCAYIAPGDYHLLVRPNGKIRLEQSEKVSGHRPSVNVLFESVADSYGSNAIGVILTGMGDDGVIGLKKMKDNNSYTIAQDEKTSIIYGMPGEAVKNNAVNKILAADKIALELIRILKVNNV